MGASGHEVTTSAMATVTFSSRRFTEQTAGEALCKKSLANTGGPAEEQRMV